MPFHGNVQHRRRIPGGLTLPAAVHPTATVEAGAQLGDGCVVGPYCHVGGEAVLGDSVELVAHVWIGGRTTLGDGVRVFPFSALGGEPQLLRDRGDGCSLEVGEGTVIREHVTLHKGSPVGAGVTRIGPGCTFMAGTHAAHDCQLGSGVLLNQGAILGGHVEVGESAVFGAQSGVHPYCRIGRHSMAEAKTGVFHDVIPYGYSRGTKAYLKGINAKGLKHRGFSTEIIRGLKDLLGRIFGEEGTLAERLAALAAEDGLGAEAREVVDFAMAQDARRSLMQPRASSGDG